MNDGEVAVLVDHTGVRPVTDARAVLVPIGWSFASWASKTASHPVGAVGPRDADVRERGAEGRRVGREVDGAAGKAVVAGATGLLALAVDQSMRPAPNALPSCVLLGVTPRVLTTPSCQSSK